MNSVKDFLPVAFSLCFLGFEAGCSTVNSRIDANHAAFDQLAPEHQALVRDGQLAIGLPPTAVRLAVGDPTYVTLVVDPLIKTNLVYTAGDPLKPISAPAKRIAVWHYQSPSSLRRLIHGDALKVVYDRNGQVAIFEKEEPREISMGAKGQPQNPPTADQQVLVNARQIAIGFNVALVKLALGDPDRVTLRTDTAGSTVIWHYEGMLLNRASDRTTIQDRLAVAFDSTGHVLAIEQEKPIDFKVGADHHASASLTQDQLALVKERQVGIGFDRLAAKQVLGDPDRVTIRTDAGGVTLIWHYEAAQYVDTRVFDTILDWRSLPFPIAKVRYGITLAFDEGDRVSTINEVIGVWAE